jgi:hypothetical protein
VNRKQGRVVSAALFAAGSGAISAAVFIPVIVVAGPLVVVGGVLAAAAMSDFHDPIVLQMLRERLSRLRGRRQRWDVAAAARRHREAVAAEALTGR